MVYVSDEGKAMMLTAVLVALGYVASRCARVIAEEWELFADDCEID